jgi:sterol desaturase/sphingolipid hydroxylase (fatty acid hydroxylase superfamily)
MTPTILALLATAATLILLERIPALRRVRARLLRAHFGADILFLVVGWVAGARLAFLYFGAGSEVLGRGLPRVAGLGAPLWAEFLVAFILIDLGNYVAHDLMHRFESLWEFHKVHHSSRILDWLATFRAHIVESALRRLLAPLLLILIGMSPAAVAIASAVFHAWAILNHSNLRIDLRFLEPILVTPRLHHLHHVPATGQRNMGTVFTFWDRLLGRLETLPVPPDEVLGVPDEVESYPQGFVRQMREPFTRLAGRMRTKKEGSSAGTPA